MSSAKKDGEAKAAGEILVLATTAVLTLGLGIVRTKVLAIAFGRAGLGLLGLLQSAMATGILITGIGIDGVGARELARAQGDKPASIPLIRAGLSKGVFAIAAFGALLAAPILGGVVCHLGYEAEARWAPLLAIGILAGVMTANGRAVLAGHSQVGGLARSAVFGAGLALVFAASTVWLPMAPALTLAALSLPLAQWTLVRLASRQLPKVSSFQLRVSVREALSLARMASIFAIAGVLPVLSQFLIRTVAAAGLGVDQLGLFQASLTLSTTAVGVLASSMGPSLLPRLAAQTREPEQFNQTLLTQVKLYLALFAPIALAAEVVPELLLSILYSADFTTASSQLSWQMVGESLRLPCWAMATALTAQSRGRAYLLVESVTLLTTATLIGFASWNGSLQWVGVAFSISLLVQFLLLSWLLASKGFSWPRSLRVEMLVLACICAALAALVPHYWPARVVGAVAALAAGMRATTMIYRLRSSAR